MPSRLIGIIAFLTLTASSAPALAQVAGDDAAPRADEPWRSRPRVHPTDTAEDVAAAPDAVRPVAKEPSTAGQEAALAVPRVLLAPPRIVLNTVFLPIKGALYLVSKYKLVERVEDFLYNDERTAAILPSLSVLGGQGVTAGFSMFHEGWGRHKERISFEAKFGGRYIQAYELAFHAPAVAGTGLELGVTTRYEIEPGLRFYGYGPRELRDFTGDQPVGPRSAHVETRYQQRRGMVRARASYNFLPSVNLGVIGTLNRRDFGPKESDDAEPSIDEVYDTSMIPGFDLGYTLVEPLLDFRVDTRFPKGATASGVYFNAFGGGAPPQNDFRFVHYGAEIAGFIDLWMGDRILVLHAMHEGVAGDDAEIPFSDLPRLGGPKRLRGYDLHRFRDKLTALVAVEYRWPIHEYVAGVGFFEVGSVGRDYEKLVQPENYKYGGGGGFDIRSRHSKLFSVQVAYGEGVQFFLTTDPIVAFGKHGGEDL